MNLQRTGAMARKEWLHIIRDPRSLGMAIVIPMLLLVLFGYALTLDVDRVGIAVWDQDNSSTSRELVSRFAGSVYFSVQPVTSYGEGERLIDQGKTLAALVIPADFSAQLGKTKPVEVQLIMDGSDSNTATIAIGYAEATIQAFSREITLRALQQHGVSSASAPIELRPRVWFNSDMQSKNYIIPGLIAVIMMVIAALLTSLTVAREWERGTMEQLIATPVKGGELIIGKLLPYFAIGMFDVLLAVLMGQYLFHVPLRGSVGLLFGMAAIFLVGALSLGMVISIVTKSQLLASQLAMVLTFLPSFLLSGFMYSIANMPRPLQVMTHLIPSRYFVTLLKGIYLKGVGLETMAVEAGLLTLFAVVILMVAHLKFTKRLD
ncbi:MAG: ABC transporter permease [Proteobacteria bacterium]|nr:ABC transporter permease [Desulfobulbaceae bacterium]MBU4151493.1 ABC transporter permease [Pseudomonadota bacterium]